MQNYIISNLKSIYTFCDNLDKEWLGIDTLLDTNLSTADFVLRDIITFLYWLSISDGNLNDSEFNYIIDSLGINALDLDEIKESLKYINAVPIANPISDSVQVLVKADMLKLGKDVLYSLKLLNIYKYLGNNIISADGIVAGDEVYSYKWFINELKKYISKKLHISIHNI